ncbi:MAG: hypothetical protein Q8R00_00590 [Candidatus Nanoarchaeia archaeon]|nr:hypothetical protein [Candidatus Nanoarchaeia archaeon]
MTSNFKKKISSYFLTFIVISLLFFTGPANALVIGLQDLSTPTPNEATVVEFTAFVDIEDGQRVPVQDLNLKIGTESCKFSPNGVEISGTLCSSVEINPLDSSPIGYGYGYGYRGTNIGYGYGYGYGYTTGYSNTVDGKTELRYRVKWTTPAVSADTSYDVTLDANVVDGSKSFVYSNTQSNFILVKDVPASSGNGGGGGGGGSTSTITRAPAPAPQQNIPAAQPETVSPTPVAPAVPETQPQAVANSPLTGFAVAVLGDYIPGNTPGQKALVGGAAALVLAALGNIGWKRFKLKR